VEDVHDVRARGQISGYRGPHLRPLPRRSRTNAKIEAVIWRTAYGRMRIKPEEGLEVFVTGRLTTYPGQSKYQIVVETLEPAGSAR
jgi:exodeoxyribonuclease VII large subunit